MRPHKTRSISSAWPPIHTQRENITASGRSSIGGNLYPNHRTPTLALLPPPLSPLLYSFRSRREQSGWFISEARVAGKWYKMTPVGNNRSIARAHHGMYIDVCICMYRQCMCIVYTSWRCSGFARPGFFMRRANCVGGGGSNSSASTWKRRVRLVTVMYEWRRGVQDVAVFWARIFR